MRRFLTERPQRALGGAILIGVYFLTLTWRGLDTYFSGDDLMNLQSLHGFWETPLWRLLTDTFLIWSPTYRPFGGVVYRLLYFTAGLNPVPFRVFCFFLLFGNLAIVYHVARILTRSAEVAFLSTLLFAYHPALRALYYDTGTIYDLLCCSFYLTTLWVYFAWRRSHASFTLAQVGVLLALVLLALQSKEMAVTLPAVLSIYEIFYHGIRFPSLKAFLSRYRCLILMYVLATLVLLGKLLTKNALSANSLYHPRFSLDLIGQAYAQYYHLLLPVLPLSASWVPVYWAAMLYGRFDMESEAVVVRYALLRSRAGSGCRASSTRWLCNLYSDVWDGAGRGLSTGCTPGHCGALPEDIQKA